MQRETAGSGRHHLAVVWIEIVKDGGYQVEGQGHHLAMVWIEISLHMYHSCCTDVTTLRWCGLKFG